MKQLITVALILMTACSSLYGQRTNSSTTKPATRPTTKPIQRQSGKATSKPTVKEFKLVIKDEAPEIVKDWFETFPRVAAKIRDDQRRSILKNIENAEKTLKDINERKVGMTTETDVKGRAVSRGTDLDALNQKDRDQRKQKEVIKKLNEQLQKFDSNTEPPEIALWKANMTTSDIQQPTIGSFGRLSGVIIVREIVDEQNFIGKYGNFDLWITGMDTRNLFDDKAVRYDKTIYISKTKSFTTVIGGKRTVPFAEPCPIEDYVEMVEK